MRVEARKFIGGLCKGQDGVYHYAIKQGGQPYRGTTNCAALGAAQEWLRLYRQQIARASVGIAPPKLVPTLAEALRDYETAMTGSAKAKTLDNKRTRILEHLAPELHWRLDAFDLPAMETIRRRYLDGTWAGKGWANEKTGRSIGGWNSLLRDVKAILGWAARRGDLAAMPFTMRPGKVQAKVKSVIWPEDAQKFLKAVDKFKGQDARTVVRVMLYLGMREAEALGMRWEWLRPRANTYTVGMAKGFEARVIPVPASLLAYIEGHHRRKLEGLIFTADTAGNPHVDHFSRDCIDRAARAIGVVNMHPHRLRATFASTMYELGKPLQHIMRLLGHKDEKTTVGYIVCRDADLGQSMDDYADALEGKKKKGPPGVTAPLAIKPKIRAIAASKGRASSAS